MREFFGRHIQLTGKVMDLRLQRQNIVSGNIANVNTPGYKARRLEFEEKLQSALNQNDLGKMTRTTEAHMPAKFTPDGFKGDGITEFKAREVIGKDSVDLDREMTENAKNTMMYNALAMIIKKNFQGMEKAIQEGGK
ncbi:MAG: flagellar basal body rod protein FlgB [Desulfovibrionaceae bacterium]|nr:flagellar basal body rod protein FlgB [Desulfovibrionaceae bacterium]